MDRSRFVCFSKRKNDALKKQVDDLVDLICSAQLENGYLDTLYIINDRSKIFSNLKDRHELYCFGHLTEAAVAYYNSTGNNKLLNAAIRFADLICDYFGDNENQGYPGHEIAESALAKLYYITRNEKYINQAELFIKEEAQSHIILILSAVIIVQITVLIMNIIRHICLLLSRMKL